MNYDIRKIVIAIILLVMPFDLQAAEITVFSFDNSAKIIQAGGFCNGHSVAIQISAASSTEPFYIAGSECADGKFSFRDNLDYWKILPGEYRVIVYDANSPLSDPSEEKFFAIVNLPEEYLPNEPPDAPATSTDEMPEAAAENNFFIRIFEAILKWFADVILKVKELIVEKITVLNLCVGETCINEGDLKGFLKEKKNPPLDIDKPSEEKGDGEEKEQTEPMPIPAAESPETATSSVIEAPETATSSESGIPNT